MNHYYGEHLYTRSPKNPRVLYATYDEHRARTEPDDPVWGFFQPYGAREFEAHDGDVLRQTEVPTSRGSFFRVDLSVDFLQRNQLAVMTPWPKIPAWESGWAPYRSVDNFCERIAAFDAGHPVRRALSAVAARRGSSSRVGHAFAVLAALTGDSPPEQRERAHLTARAHLEQALREDHDLRRALEAGLPERLPAALRAGDEDHALPDRAVWRFRLLYSLVLAVHDERIALTG